MLREFANTRQIAGEPTRKWYFSDEQDLVIWVDSADTPIAFQLAYGKNGYEQSVSWHPKQGYQHYVVNNDGWFQTPLLKAGGLFRKEAVIEEFLTLSAELPASVVQLVTDKLHRFEGPIYSRALDPEFQERSARQAELERRVLSGELVVGNYPGSTHCDVKNSGYPFFAMFPSGILAKAKALADEFRAEAQPKDFVWHNVFGVTAVIIFLLFANGANGFVFGSTAEAMLKGSAPSLVPYIWTYAVIVVLGGMAFSLNAFITWLELLAYRHRKPRDPAKPVRLRFYRRATWIPLIPLIAVPAIFNALFDVSFFLGTVGFAFVAVLVATLSADV